MPPINVCGPSYTARPRCPVCGRRNQRSEFFIEPHYSRERDDAGNVTWGVCKGSGLLDGEKPETKEKVQA